MNPQNSFEQVAFLLPPELRRCALGLPEEKKSRAEEVRLRAGQPMSFGCPEREYTVPDSPVLNENMLRSVLEIATRASVHTVLDKVRNGFVTAQGGHRIGLCGAAVTEGGKVCNLREVSSLNIRIARQVRGVSAEVLPQLIRDGRPSSALILSPPGGGKTTLLRDLVRGLSNGEEGRVFRIGIADERGELAAMCAGKPQMDVGRHTDVMDGCPKAEGLMMLLRGMNPQILAADEITAPEDVEAMLQAAGCGVALLATAHAGSPEDLKRRPLWRRILQERIFECAVLIKIQNGVRTYEVRRLEDISCCG